MRIELTFTWATSVAIVIDALTEKYGKAQISRREKFEGPSGGSYYEIGNYLEWRRGNSTILVRQRDPPFSLSIGGGVVEYYLDSYLPLVEKRNKQRTKEHAKDL